MIPLPNKQHDLEAVALLTAWIHDDCEGGTAAREMAATVDREVILALTGLAAAGFSVLAKEHDKDINEVLQHFGLSIMQDMIGMDRDNGTDT